MTRSRRLWVIDPSVKHPEEQGVRNVIGDWGGETRVFQPALVTGDGPDTSTGYDLDAVAVLGAACSVNDAPPWYAPLADWLKPILNGEVPVAVLGICFGHQMMAHCAGGEVGYLTADRDKLVDIQTSKLQGARMMPGQHDLRVAVSHNEEVKRLPPGYDVIASRGPVAIDGMQHATLPLWSFQFHPEAGTDFARTSGIGVDKLDDRQREDSERLLRAFRESVQ